MTNTQPSAAVTAVTDASEIKVFITMDIDNGFSVDIPFTDLYDMVTQDVQVDNGPMDTAFTELINMHKENLAVDILQEMHQCLNRGSHNVG